MIRQAVLEDLDQITLLVKDVGNLHARNRTDIFLPGAVTADKEKCKKRILGEKYHILVEEKEGQILGVCMAFIRTIKNDIKLRNAKVLRIEEIVVRPEMRKKGIGSALIRCMKRYALDNDCCRIETNVWGFNHVSHRFMIKERFTVQQQTMEYFFEEKRIEMLYASTQKEIERCQLSHKSIEISNTLRHLFEEIQPEMSVLDCAAGTGTYVTALYNKGYKVTASDLSIANVRYMMNSFNRDKFHIDIFHDNAMDLSRHPNCTYDAVVCMGPAYHLSKSDLKKCLKECLRVVKDEGKVLVSYLNKNFWGPYILENRAKKYSIGEILEMMETGTFSKEADDFVGNSFFYSSDEIKNWINQFENVDISNHFTLDGNWQIAYGSIERMKEEEKNALADYIFSYSEQPEQISSGKNNMIVLRKKKENEM